MWNSLIESKYPVFLDGASGTLMQEMGLPKGVCPEKWALEHPEHLTKLHHSYIEAGSQVIYCFSFGANSKKLSDYGLEDQVYEMNKSLAEHAKSIAGSKALVAGDIAPTGDYCPPMGNMVFEDLVQIYKEQVRGLIDGGVDLFALETMMDLQEIRAAVLAVKESCNLPIIASMTFEPNGRTLTGASPEAVLLTLQGMGVDVIGCNCSTGPESMAAIIEKMAKYAKVPLMAKPNAGLPKLIDGETHFDMDADDYIKACAKLLDAGVQFIGGCCGTRPHYIEGLWEAYKNKPVKKEAYVAAGSYVCSARQVVKLGQEEPMAIVGERINPTGKKKLQESLKLGEMNIVLDLAREQMDKGAAILDVNVGMNGIDEKETMVKAIEALAVTGAPLCIDSSNPEVIEAALRVYPGRALLNSVSNEGKKRDTLLQVAKKYGAMLLVLPIGDHGLPKSTAAKIELIEEIYNKAREYGFTKEDIVVDGLVMTVSSAPQAVSSTLETIEWCTNSFGVNTIVGLSNVSFGLPARKWVNGTFLAMAAAKGLSMAIANPSSELLMHTKFATDVLCRRDENCNRYIDHFSEGQSESVEDDKITTRAMIYDTVLKGKHKDITEQVQTGLQEGIAAEEIVNEILIPAINEVGRRFEEQIYYLPQLMMSAKAMKEGFTLLEPLLYKDVANAPVKKSILLATVQGDIHDIGKNIVALMFKNHGFHVIDLGKDVKVATIIEAVKEHNPDILGLSALMTTTMVAMKEVMEEIRLENLSVKVMIGGAVITQSYADEIGAHGYSKDANEAVKVAKALLQEG